MARTTNMGVLLLASEWGSKRGALSAFIREFAIHLAKHPDVHVSVFVPRCDHDEKTAALNSNVTLVQAKRMPGFDELDWLCIPPDDLQIDFVIGHGVALGRQAQFIRERRQCMWVQFVHTNPEELGMFKGYSEAISKAEKKHRDEVELCLIADCVVAVGQKLAEAYSSYLRFCGKVQNVFVFTPGIFSEFLSVKQVKSDGKKFGVLAFGRGDAEDFSLKGFDIAARAVAKLNDAFLIFIDAQNKKGDEIASRLKAYDNLSYRVSVRKIPENREHLKRLFVEVDLAIFPWRTEGFGLVALEAFSAGLPILVSNNSGLGEVLKKKVPHGSMFVVDSDDAEKWAKEMEKVWKKKRKIRLDESRDVRDYYSQEYKWEDQCRDLVEKMKSIHRGKELLLPLIHSFMHYTEYITCVNVHASYN